MRRLSVGVKRLCENMILSIVQDPEYRLQLMCGRPTAAFRQKRVRTHQNSIKLGSHKSKSWLVNCLGKGLVLYTEVSDTNSVSAVKAIQRPTAVLDCKLSTVCLQCIGEPENEQCKLCISHSSTNKHTLEFGVMSC